MKFSDIELPSNKSFGLVFFTIFLVVGGYFVLKDAPMTGSTFILMAFSFLIVSFLRPQLLLPINKLWMFFGFLMGKVMSPIILGLIFFLLFTPLGIFLRILGRDESKLKSKKQVSYWKTYQNTRNSFSTFKNQF